LLAAAPHPRLIGLGQGRLDDAHAKIARAVLGHEQRQLLRLRLLPRLVRRSSAAASQVASTASSDSLGTVSLAPRSSA